MRRLQKFAQDGYLANESVEDSLIDNIVYGVIALALFREETDATQEGQVEQDGQPEHSHGDEGGEAAEAGSSHCPVCRWTKPEAEVKVDVRCNACGLVLSPWHMITSTGTTKLLFVHDELPQNCHPAMPTFNFYV